MNYTGGADKAGKAYWNANWAKEDFALPFDPKNKSLDNQVNLELHRYFQKLLNNKKEVSVLEIGCATSIWPIYFYQQYNAKVSGLDYSDIGCARSKTLLKHYNVPAEIYCADLFNPPQEILKKFDLVVSFGVVEHFEDTQGCLRAAAEFVKPGGYLLTFVPNIPSINGFIQKYIDRAIYDIHVPLTREKLSEAHQSKELVLVECDYFMSINFNVIVSGKFASHPLNKYFRKILSACSKIVWLLGRYGVKIPRNRITSPYIIALAYVN